jgi:hypothetical protein
MFWIFPVYARKASEQLRRIWRLRVQEKMWRKILNERPGFHYVVTGSRVE